MYIPSNLFVVSASTADHLLEPKALLQLLVFASVITPVLILWNGLRLLTNSDSPIVVVLRSAFYFVISDNVTQQRPLDSQ